MSFNSIRIMACDTFPTPKINMWSDWWWLLGVSTQTIVIFPINRLFLPGKSFPEVNKPQTHLLMSYNSIGTIAGYNLQSSKINELSDWWWFLGWCLCGTIVIFTTNRLFLYGKIFFISQKYLKILNLSATIAWIMDGYIF